MTSSSVKKYSILGLVLIAASAVAAAVIPSKSKSHATVGKPGQLEASDAGQVSCVTLVAGDQQCTVTEDSDTTANKPGTSAHDNSSANGVHTTAD